MSFKSYEGLEYELSAIWFLIIHHTGGPPFFLFLGDPGPRLRSGALWDPPWAILGTILVPSGISLESFWSILNHFGPLWAHVGCFWTI